MIESPYQPSPDRYDDGMIYRRAGRSGVLLPAFSLGMWHNFGSGQAFSNVQRMAHYAFDRGITHFDLANNYGPAYGTAEENFGRLMERSFRPYRDEMFIATKAGYDMWPGPYGNWGSRKYLTASLDQSLRRMKLDYVDIFYSHRHDPETPLEETLQALVDIVRRGKALSEISEKRLEAIREFTSFGSGFRIAMRDLEIRGAGNILGSAQHGQMEAVGYDLYLRLLGDAIREQKGEKPVENLECLVDIQIEAHIPEKYIPSLAQRIDIYKKIAAIRSEEDWSDTMDELCDRFGEPPRSVAGLLDVALIRSRAAALGIREIDQRVGSLLFYSDRIDRGDLLALTKALPGRVLMNAGAKPYLTVKLQKGQEPMAGIREVLTVLEAGRPAAAEGCPQ